MLVSVFARVFACGPSLVSSPAGADSLSLSCQRKSAKKGAPDAATLSLDFCREEGEEANSLRADSLLFFPPRNKNPRRRIGQESQKPNHLGASPNDKANLATGWPLAFVFRLCPLTFCLDGALNFCCREEKGRGTEVAPE
ncbi:hypothetical protein, partial [Ralstonia solanacearum]|uniref:hypothetical protein n=1 Tax=Ralstonia solanacearum TaxID=305 RepID=UPI001E514D2E